MTIEHALARYADYMLRVAADAAAVRGADVEAVLLLLCLALAWLAGLSWPGLTWPAGRAVQSARPNDELSSPISPACGATAYMISTKPVVRTWRTGRD